MLIYLGCSGKFAAEVNETFYGELNMTSENLTTFGYEIAHFNDGYAEVRNTLERISIVSY